MTDTLNSIHQLKKAARYLVCQDFVDFYNNPFARGERLTFMEYHFLPYHGGYTIIFKEKNLYLQEQVNAGILDALGDYLSLVEE